MRDDRPRPSAHPRRPRPLDSRERPELVLTLSPGPDGAFLVHARSDQGETQGRFRLPWTAAAWDALLRPLGRRHRNLSPVDGTGPDAAAPLDLRREGVRLFDALFDDAGVRGLYRAARAAAPAGRLRLRLVLDPDLPGTSPLHRVPWEALLDPERGELLALAEGVSVVRTLMLARPPGGFEHRRPVRVLVLLSGAADLDLDREREELAGLARRHPGLRVACSPASDLDALETLLGDAGREGRPFHVLHLAGHGEVCPGPEGGVLLWEPPGGPPLRISGRRLATLLRRFPELRLVVVNACTTAELPGDGPDAFAGVAAALLQGGVPVVVAVQGAIRDEAALVFSRSFYGALAEGATPEEAVAAARWALWKPDPGETEWLKPVLFQGAPRPGLPRWLKRTAAALFTGLLAVSLLAAAQAYHLADQDVAGAVETAKGLLLDDRPVEAARVVEGALDRSSWPPVGRGVRAAAHATAAVAAEDLGDLAAATEHATAAASLEPDRALHHYNLGALLARAGRPGEAALPLRRALEIDPGLAAAANELGCVQLDLDRPGEALPTLQAGVARHPEHALLHKNLGRALLALERPAEAVTPLERSLELLPLQEWPARAEASFHLARAEAGRGNRTGACAALGRFREADPQAATRFAADAEGLAETTGCPFQPASRGGRRVP